MNPLIDLLDQALQANLSKRQWAVFATVLRQTLGFRKPEDDIAPRRMEQLTGIQRNHIWQAKKALEAQGLLESRPGRYGEILSFPLLTSGDEFPLQTVKIQTELKIQADPGAARPPIPPPLRTEPVVPDGSTTLIPPIPPPLAPETGQKPPKTGQPCAQIGRKPVPKQDTTSNNLTVNNHYTVVAVDEPTTVIEPGALHYPPELSAAERQQAPASLDGLNPQAAQQVLDVWAHKIRQGEVRKSRMGLLIALVKAQRQGALDTRCLGTRHPASPAPDDPVAQQQQQAREHWLEQQAQQAWLRDMQHFGVSVTDLQPPAFCPSGGAL